MTESVFQAPDHSIKGEREALHLIACRIDWKAFPQVMQADVFRALGKVHKWAKRKLHQQPAPDRRGKQDERRDEEEHAQEAAQHVLDREKGGACLDEVSGPRGGFVRKGVDDKMACLVL